jgi:hypothetical protein
MMKFVNREPELQFLEKKYLSEQAELIVLYGRRRIGKTELLLHFAEGKKVLYFLGRLESKADTLRRINNLFIDSFKDLGLLRTALRTWDDVFDYLAEKSRTSRIVVVFDEFPFIIEKFPEVISVLQDKWDNVLKKTKLMLILSGSSISMMEKYAINYKSPLYGRRTGQWQLNKLKIRHLKEFFPEYAVEDLLLVYSCLDTIPAYLVKFSPRANVWENIKDKMLSKGEFLYEEIEVLLREELRDPSNYMSILSAVAGGLTSFNEIYTRTQLDKSLLSKYLFILERLGVVEKIMPVTEGYKSKLKAKGLYVLKDNFFDFWFRFVYPNKQMLEGGKTDLVLKQMKKEMNRYLGVKFEGLVREIVPEMNIMDVTRVGRWWHKDEEIDVVALDEGKKEILLAECKWQDDVDALKILNELKEKSTHVDWQKAKRKETFAIFARSFKRRIKEKNVFCFDLRDIESLLRKISV